MSVLQWNSVRILFLVVPVAALGADFVFTLRSMDPVTIQVCLAAVGYHSTARLRSRARIHPAVQIAAGRSEPFRSGRFVAVG